MAPVVSPSAQPAPFPAAVKANGKSKPTIPAMANSSPPTQVQNPVVRPSFAFDSMEDALAAFTRGEFLVVMDDENRENEGDLIIAASFCTTEKMAWMIKHTRYVQMSDIFRLVCLISGSVGIFASPSLESAWTNWTYLRCFLQTRNDTERPIQSQSIIKSVRRKLDRFGHKLTTNCH